MSDPVTNVQIEDVLSSIRRLVSEEIGQQELLKLRSKKIDEDEEHKLVLSPAQKVRQDAAEKGSDLWEATQEMAPVEAAPVWWHRDASELSSNEPDEPMPLGEPLAAEAVTDDVVDPEPETVEVVDEPALEEPLETSAEQDASPTDDATIDIDDDDFEPPEGEVNIDFGVKLDAMPWQDDDAETEYSGSIEGDAEELGDEIPFSFRPGERLFERLSSKKMSASHLPDVETVESSADADDLTSVTDPELDALLQLEPEGIEEPDDTSAEVNEAEPIEENYFNEDYAAGDLTNIFDEDMLRDMVKDIIRQELQGVLGERITRNVRKLVRREIQRAISEVNKV